MYSILAKFPTSVDPPERLGLSGEKEASRLSLSLTAKGKKLVRAGVLMRFSSRSLRFASGIEFHFTSHGSAPPHRPSRHLCHHHLRHHWLGTLFRQIAHDLLRPRNG